MRRALVASALLGIAGVSAAADLPRCENLKVAKIPDQPLAQGRVSDPQIVESSDKRLSAASLKEAVRWRFVPPRQPCRHRVPITYQIKD